MASTYEPIASVTLTSDGTPTFTSIPGTFTDLVLVMHVRSSSASANRYVGIRVNGDTGSNYSVTRLAGNGTTASSSRASSQSRIDLGGIPGDGATSGIFGVVRVHLMSYADTNVYKTVLASNDSSSNTDQAVTRTVGLWRSTSAITSIEVYDYGDGVALESGSTFALYGIKAA